MNQREAIRQVAQWAAANIQGGTFSEATGLEEDDMTDADAERLGKAVEYVVERLYRMGGTA